MTGGPLDARFARHLRESGLIRRGDRVVVALSGGVDSTVLLHLLRFGPHALDLDLVAGHVDHRMRSGSGADAAWVRGLARAWGVACRIRRVEDPPGSEAEARRARYALLEELRREEGARLVATAHHADDQAETVLFRALRGTGIRGLAGMPPARDPGVVRPLLPFFREEIEAYAGERRIGRRTDPTNRDLSRSRNRIRHRILPEVEAGFAPGARRALARLARLARENEEGWESVLPRLRREAGFREERCGVSLDRGRFQDYHRHVRARIVRGLARRHGIALDEAGTRAALEFISTGVSGRELQLAGALRIAREFDRIRVWRAGERPGAEEEDRPLRIDAPERGSGELRIGGRRWRAAWSPDAPPPGRWQEAVDPGAVGFPLTLRGWNPGDRLTFSYGSKKLKKVFGEETVPRGRRSRLPVLADAEGRVLWVPGVARSAVAPGAGADPPLYLTVTDVDDG